MMKKAKLTQRQIFMTLIILSTTMSLTGCRSCSRPQTNRNTAVSVEPDAKLLPPPSPTPPPIPPEVADDDDSSSAALQFKASVRETESIVSLIRAAERRLRFGHIYKLITGDRIKTYDTGKAELNIADCMTVYLSEDSGLSLSTCEPGTGALCATAGTSTFNNRCSSHVHKIETDTAEIRLDGTFLRVAYWPAKKRTIIDVHQGPVQVFNVTDPRKHRLGSSVQVNQGCWCVPSDQCFKPGTAADKPQPCTELTPENQVYLDRTKAETAEHLRKDHIPIAPAPVLTNVNFGDRVIGTESFEYIPVVNISSVPLIVGQVSLNSTTGALRQVDENCTVRPLDSGKQCMITVSFKPQTLGTHEGFVSISDNALASPRRIQITGRAINISDAIVFKVAPSFVNFGTVGLSSTSKPSTLTITNEGRPLEIDVPSLEGPNKEDFKIIAHNCINPIVKQCTIDLTFKPHAMERSDAVVVIKPRNAQSGYQQRYIEIFGTGGPADSNGGTSPGTHGVRPAAPHMVITSEPPCFAGHKVVKNSDVKIREQQVIAVTNTGSGPLVMNTVLPSNGDFFAKPESCTAPGINDKCQITIGFTPRGTGTRKGILTINSNDASNSSRQISLTGRGKPRNWFKRAWQRVFRRNQKPVC